LRESVFATPGRGSREEADVSLQELNQVHASHDIRRFRTTVVTRGVPGRIIAIWPGRTDTTYTVEFSPPGVRGATIVMADLDDHDVCL